MLTQLLFDALMWFLDGALTLVSFVVPEAAMEAVGTGMAFLAVMLSYGPAGLVGVCLLAYLAIDTALNGFVFAISTYRLIPAKMT